MTTGTQSITFEKSPYLIRSASVVGKKEGQELIIYKEGKKTTAYLDKEMIVLI